MAGLYQEHHSEDAVDRAGYASRSYALFYGRPSLAAGEKLAYTTGAKNILEYIRI